MAVSAVKPLRDNGAYFEQRVDLACAFRWTAKLNMHESVANHFSLAVNDDGTQFLLNPNAMHFSRIRASDLILIDANEPSTMDQPNAPERTAWALHGAIHRNNPQARCVLHAHSKYATVLACLADSTIPPIDQNTARFFNRIAVDEGYDGMALDDEAERCSQLLGDKKVMVMGNHGVLVTGQNVAEAFDCLYYLERSAETLITAYMTGRPLRVLSDEVAEKTAQQWEDDALGQNHFRELKMMLDQEAPDYRT
ncbi:class II aldolase and adducin N-terminal domain-containing protein [Pelagibius sp. Alg239-R121]|uniref:class II aldolase and adducin N-terminal domain-containing protein n=1 Tax=Pelagibius sp. Alg239-R121 TaxID=2993448 RepID=UPI0024A6A745|nr:class II aldolase and adducin N-terminal domain-containing protein [Pelagibius sp. Alg239-R121]